MSIVVCQLSEPYLQGALHQNKMTPYGVILFETTRRVRKILEMYIFRTVNSLCFGE